mmetsp:Transcript_28483/g.80209  ORF Transcript_28483/g.80209 Transcript_28483/m.80209 type:complete len:183 (+) Transcript_28483:765-1313(+)
MSVATPSTATVLSQIRTLEAAMKEVDATMAAMKEAQEQQQGPDLQPKFKKVTEAIADMAAKLAGGAAARRRTNGPCAAATTPRDEDANTNANAIAIAIANANAIAIAIASNKSSTKHADSATKIKYSPPKKIPTLHILANHWYGRGAFDGIPKKRGLAICERENNGKKERRRGNGVVTKAEG